jgi:peptidoglycan-associated lipoprotein
MRRTLMLLLVATSLAVAGCGNKPKPTETPVDTSASSDANAAGAGSEGANEEGADAPGPLEGMLAKRVIYFDFDSSEIRGEGTDIVAAHAKHLSSNNGQKIRLEGHTDERGSREYNIGLGERRSQAVRRALLLQGAGETQLSTVSYGEERPAAAGADESAWQRNRRVEIVYLQ